MRRARKTRASGPPLNTHTHTHTHQVWGLDFGDCHRSLFAHQDAVTSLAFVRDTHYAFSGGKDKMVKYWDLDRCAGAGRGWGGSRGQVCTLLHCSEGAGDRVL